MKITYTHPYPVTIKDGQIIFYIPDYDLEILLPSVHRAKGSGASYVKHWTKLPPTLLKMLTTWRKSGFFEALFSKPELRDYLANEGCIVGQDPINARVSELLGLNLVVMELVKNKPKYRLHIDRVNLILANHGRLPTLQKEQVTPF